MPREVQYRKGNGQWLPVDIFARKILEAAFAAPTSGEYRFRHRYIDENQDPTTKWGYSDPLDVVVPLPDIVKDLPPGKDCPPADEGEYLQGWVLPDGSRRWIRRPVFGPIPDQATIGLKGAAGVIWGFDNATFSVSPHVPGLYERISSAAEKTTTWKLNDDLAESASGFHIQSVEVGTRGIARGAPGGNFAKRGKLNLILGTAGQPHGTGQQDFNTDIESNLAAALRFADDKLLVFDFADTAEPYLSNALTGDALVLLNEKFTGGASVENVAIRIFRKDERCAGDELNPWVEIQAAGGRYIEIVIYTKVTRGTDAPAAPTAASYDFDTGVLTGGGVWSLTPPAVEDDEVAYARIGTVSSTAPGSIVWSTARVWTAGVELDAIYRRGVTKPNRPADSTTQVPAGWSPSVAATTGNTTLWVVNQHRTGESAVWQRGEVLQAEGTDGEAKRVETIYGAHTEDTLASNQQPLDSWTFEQVRRGSPITRSGVVWASNLTDAGFSKDKEYGYVARREVPNDASRGDAVDDTWDVNLEAHWGLGAPAGLLTRFIYDDIGTTNGDGKYQFYSGGSTTARSGTALNGDWSRIKDADYLEVGDTEKDGWPCLEWGDLTTDDFVVYEPSSSQWVAFDISSVTEITGGWRFGISKTEVSDGGGADISTADGNNADFYLSVPRRQMPQPLRGAAAYNASRREPPTNRSGYFDFHSATPPSTANDLNQLSHAVKQAIAMQIWQNDEHGNLFDSLEALTNGQYIALAVLDTPHWAAWKVTSVSESNGLYTIGLELYSYATSLRGPNIIQYGTAADVEFYVTPFIAPSADTIGVRIRPIDDVKESDGGPVPYVADVYGTAIANATPALKANIGRAGPGNLPSGYRISNPVWNSATRTATGNITLPSSITADERVFVGIQARVAGVAAIGRDNEFFNHVNDVTTQTLPTLTNFTMRAGSTPGDVVFSPGTLHANATGWQYKIATTSAGLASASWSRTYPRGTTTATADRSEGRRYYGTVRQVSTSSAWDNSAAATAKNVLTSSATTLATPTATASSNAVGAVTVGWDAAPTGANGVVIEYKKSSTRSWVGATGVTVRSRTTRTRTITGLDQGARYDFRVAFTPASSAYLQSDWDEVDDVAVQLKLPTPTFVLSYDGTFSPPSFFASITNLSDSAHGGWAAQAATTRAGVASATVRRFAQRAGTRRPVLSAARGTTVYVRLQQLGGDNPRLSHIKDSDWSAIKSYSA